MTHEVEAAAYILRAMEEIEKNGDPYANDEELYQACRLAYGVTFNAYRADKAVLIRSKALRVEGKRIYRARMCSYENFAAKRLAELLGKPQFDVSDVENPLTCDDVILNADQREAVLLALKNRISVICGGAGSGKTTTIQAILEKYKDMDEEKSVLLAAPTGKAARVLSQATGWRARTVHSALGRTPDDDFLAPVEWPQLGLIIIDESSMLSLELLAGILSRMPDDCRCVLVGDPGQLQAVGAGNVLLDLRTLNVPGAMLKTQYRQRNRTSALTYNVHAFAQIRTGQELRFDESFRFISCGEDEIVDAMCCAAKKYWDAGEDVQMLAATKDIVQRLNLTMQAICNPRSKSKLEYGIFREGDQVMILKNIPLKSCCNGDVGILHFENYLFGNPCISVVRRNGGVSTFTYQEARTMLTLAYASTIHKAQGSQAEHIIIYCGRSGMPLIKRNLIYTAISRARTDALLVGDRTTLERAIQTQPRARKSMLVIKTRQAQHGWPAA